MARKKIASPVVEKVQPYLEGVAKNLVDRLYGPNGLPWGTKLTELEDVVIAVRQALSEKMLAEALERQTQTVEQRPEPYQNFPVCSGRGKARPDGEPPKVQTRAGGADWDKPHCYCRKCR